MPTVELERPSPTTTGGRLSVPARPASLHPDMNPGDVAQCGAAAVDDLAAVFPTARPCSAVPAALARRRAPPCDACASTTAWLIAEGLASLDSARREHILERWSDVQDRGPSLVRDGGCDVRLGRVAVGMAARAALLEWLPLARHELAVYEGGLFQDEPAHAITLLVRPPTIWSLDEALLAARLHPRGRQFAPERFIAFERHAHERIGVEQLTRVRGAIGRIEAQIPAAGFPVASTLVAAGCAVIAADEEWSRLVAARQLARYASSALVAAFV